MCRRDASGSGGGSPLRLPVKPVTGYRRLGRGYDVFHDPDAKAATRERGEGETGHGVVMHEVVLDHGTHGPR